MRLGVVVMMPSIVMRMRIRRSLGMLLLSVVVRRIRRDGAVRIPRSRAGDDGRRLLLLLLR
jgi:hypothetical protein